MPVQIHSWQARGLGSSRRVLRPSMMACYKMEGDQERDERHYVYKGEYQFMSFAIVYHERTIGDSPPPSH